MNMKDVISIQQTEPWPNEFQYWAEVVKPNGLIKLEAISLEQYHELMETRIKLYVGGEKWLLGNAARAAYDGDDWLDAEVADLAATYDDFLAGTGRV